MKAAYQWRGGIIWASGKKNLWQVLGPKILFIICFFGCHWLMLAVFFKFYCNIEKGQIAILKGAVLQFEVLKIWKLSYFPLSNFYNRNNLKIMVLGTYMLHYFLNFWPKINWAYNVACTMYHLHGFKFFWPSIQM